jgi:hypothetical protein
VLLPVLPSADNTACSDADATPSCCTTVACGPTEHSSTNGTVNVCNELNMDVLLPVTPSANNTACIEADVHQGTPAFIGVGDESYDTCTFQPLQQIEMNNLLAGLVSHDANQPVAGESSRHVTQVPLNLSLDTTHALTGSQISQLIQFLGQINSKSQATDIVTSGATAAADLHVATVLEPASSNDVRSESGHVELHNPKDSVCAKQSRCKSSSRKPRLSGTRRTRVVSQASVQ